MSFRLLGRVRRPSWRWMLTKTWWRLLEHRWGLFFLLSVFQMLGHLLACFFFAFTWIVFLGVPMYIYSFLWLSWVVFWWDSSLTKENGPCRVEFGCCVGLWVGDVCRTHNAPICSNGVLHCVWHIYIYIVLITGALKKQFGNTSDTYVLQYHEDRLTLNCCFMLFCSLCNRPGCILHTCDMCSLICLWYPAFLQTWVLAPRKTHEKKGGLLLVAAAKNLVSNPKQTPIPWFVRSIWLKVYQLTKFGMFLARRHSKAQEEPFRG